MRVFISEYVCGGAWTDGVPGGSLAAEGCDMLLASLVDLLASPSLHVVTTWDSRLGEFPLQHSLCQRLINVAGWAGKNQPLAEQLLPRLTTRTVADPVEEAAVFAQECQLADAVFVIAPEFHGILVSVHELQVPRTSAAALM